MYLTKHLGKGIVLSALLLSSAHAASTFPRGCEVTGFGFNQNFLVLNPTGSQAYFLIKNNSDAQIELERQSASDAFMNPPLEATIDPLNWGAFASDEKEMNFKCYRRTENNTALIDCKDVLEVCQYPRVRFALSNMGNYWISANKPQNDVIQESVNKGIYLKW